MSAQDHQQPRQRDPLIGDSDETETNTSSRDGGGSTSTLQLLEDVSHAQAMENLLRNERYADIQLQSSDGVMIHANRAMLAARSPMFDRMLYGNFAERTSETVVVSYTKGDILQAIVQYIYRDDCDIFQSLVVPASGSTGAAAASANKTKLDLINTMVSIYDAAHYFSLPSLCRRTMQLSRSMMLNEPSSAALFFAACETAEREAGAATTELEQLSLEVICRNPKTCLLRDDNPNIRHAFRQMTGYQLQKLLTYRHLNADEHTKFLLLNAWANACDDDDSCGDVTADTSSSNALNSDQTQRVQRKRRAAEMTEHLHLEKIDASQLSTIVKASGLVSTKQFCEAYKQQAMLAGYLIVRNISWKSNSDADGVVFDCQSTLHHSVELLNCRALKYGIHKWSIKLECSGGNDQYLGVAACCMTSGGNNDEGDIGNNRALNVDPNQWLGSQAVGWVYGSNGSACHAMGHNNYYYDDRRPVFDQGSTITFLLDLTTGGGTLSASVDGLATCQLFTNMLPELPNDRPHAGFVPAVSLRTPGRVRFLGFDVS